MRRAIGLLTLTVTLFVAVCEVRAEDPQLIHSRILSLGLFKNGLAVVRRTLEVSGEGEFQLADLPEVVHGTFWIESDRPVQVRLTTREIDAPLSQVPGSDYQHELPGAEVTIHFRDANMRSITGKVLPLPDEKHRGWDRNYEPPSNISWASSSGRVEPSRSLVIQTQEGRMYIDSSAIAAVQVKGDPAPVRRSVPVMLLRIDHASGAAAPQSSSITISYLAKGMAWAPNYHVDLSDPRTLTIAQQAVIRNELEDFQDAEVMLISGFPSIEFGHVRSPISPGSTLASFFNQLNQHIDGGRRSNVTMQQAVTSNAFQADDVQLPPAEQGEGVDLYVQSVGKLSMRQGDSILLNVDHASGDYERIVEWKVADLRDVYGSLASDWERQQSPEKFENTAWDSVRFRNPFTKPMTTAPAMIVTGSAFNGQRTSTWANPGEQSTLQITKALSVRTRALEFDEGGERETREIAGRKFRKSIVKGELSVSNSRSLPITIVIRRQFSGDLIEASDSPKSALREEGVYSINRRNELTWTLQIEPGAEKVLTYRYAVLVPM
jgi:hypothetical protein